MRPKLKRKLMPVFLYVILGMIFGIIFTTTLNLNNNSEAQKTAKQSVSSSTSPTMGSIEQPFIKIPKEVGPAVVSISTVQTKKVATNSNSFGDFFGERDDFFNKFFKDFFGQMPEREYKQMGLGSGVIIDKKGYILTNEHVINGADDITVTLPDGREFKGKVKGTDPRSDLAVIKIDASNLPVVKLGNSDNIKIGEWVVAIGSPFGFYLRSAEPTVTVGVVSALHRQLPQTHYRNKLYTNLIQTDAAINPGNSGGPLVNLEGEVIGINVAIISSTGGYQGIGFAIPINTAKHRLDRLIKGEEIEYGWLGVSAQNLTKALADYFKLKSKEGVLVAKVFKDSPAAKAGIKEGDIIKEFDGKKIENARELVNVISTTEVGKEVKVKVLRNNKPLILIAKVERIPGDIRALGRKASGKWKGITVRGITPDIASKYNIPKGKGVIVTDVDPGSIAYSAGIRAGNVIYSINRKPANSVDNFNEITKGIAKGDSVLIRTNQGYVIIRTNG